MAALRLAIDIRDTGRKISDVDREVLRGYASWGAFGQLFDESSDDYAAELQQILTAEEYAEARRSILTALYTPAELISTLWTVPKYALRG